MFRFNIKLRTSNFAASVFCSQQLIINAFFSKIKVQYYFCDILGTRLHRVFAWNLLLFYCKQVDLNSKLERCINKHVHFSSLWINISDPLLITTTNFEESVSFYSSYLYDFNWWFYRCRMIHFLIVSSILNYIGKLFSYTL